MWDQGVNLLVGTHLQFDINSISDWISSAGLQPNPNKTNFMVISKNSHLHSHHRILPVVPWSLRFTSLPTWELPSAPTSPGQHTLTTPAQHVLKSQETVRSVLAIATFILLVMAALSNCIKFNFLPLLDYCSCVWDHSSIYGLNILAGVHWWWLEQCRGKMMNKASIFGYSAGPA